jgi:Skp family chaperone for outer membrane proteins
MLRYTTRAICSSRPLRSCLLLLLANTVLAGDKREESPGFEGELAAGESVVSQVVQDIASDSVVRGTYVYEKDRTLSGAVPAKSSDYYGPWQGSGHVFYKVLTGALAPRHFKNTSDIGTITVRYVVQPVNDRRTRVHIDAVFFERGRRRADASDGSVESAEFKAIQDDLQKLQLAQQQAADASAKREQEDLDEQLRIRQRNEEAGRLTSAQRSVTALEQRVDDLRRQTQMRVVGTGGQLLSAPFHSAAVLQKLPGYTELLLVIITRYWYGVETSTGQHGWVHRQQLEPLP